MDSKFNIDDCFSCVGVLVFKSKVDYVFILYMIYYLYDGGMMVCVVFYGVLFCGVLEGKICRYLIEVKNYIDVIIGFLVNLFYGMFIFICILVLKKCCKEGDDVFFIDVLKGFEKIKI